METQVITLELGGITAAEYLSDCRHGDAPPADGELRSVAVGANPRGGIVTAFLLWRHAAPAADAAAEAAGFHLTQEVVAVRAVAA